MRGLKCSFSAEFKTFNNVAPYTGAWIEIQSVTMLWLKVKSHPTRVRGLKYTDLDKQAEIVKSHPTRVRGLKFSRSGDGIGFPSSHPTRVRGLK